MKTLTITFLLTSILLLSGCKSSQNTIQPQPSAYQPSSSGFRLTSEGFTWTDDKNALPFEEVIKKAPFNVKQPEIPFEVTHKTAIQLPAPFEGVGMTYVNATQGLQFTLGEAHSKYDTNPKGEMGPKLQNGSQTWLAGDQAKSGLYWIYDGVTYSIISFKIENGQFVPLYGDTKLIEIANTIK